MYNNEVDKKKETKLHWYCLIIAALLPLFVYWRLWTPNILDRHYISHDITLLIYPFFEFMVESMQAGNLPLWNWHVYAGMYQGGAFVNWVTYPFNWPLFFGVIDTSLPVVFHFYLLFHISVGAVSFYIFSRTFSLSPIICLLGATAYSFSATAIYSAYMSCGFLYFFAWSPFTFWAYARFFACKRVSYALLGGIGWWFCLLSLNPMLFVPLGLVLLIWMTYSVVALWKQDENIVPVTGWLVLSLILSVGLVASAALPIVESTSVATRNALPIYDWAKLSWAGEITLSKLVQSFLLPEYQSPLWVSFGCVGLILYIYGIYAVKEPLEKAIRNASVVIGLSVYGQSVVPVYDIMYLCVPLVARINGFDRAGIAFLIPAILVAQFGLNRLKHCEFRKGNENPYILVLFVFAIGTLLYLFYYPEGASQTRIDQYRNLVLHVVVFFILSVLILRLIKRGNTRENWILLLVILHVLDVSALTRFFYAGQLMTEEALNGSNLVAMQSPYLPKYQSVKTKGPSIARPRIHDPKNNQVMLQNIDNVGGYYQFQPYRVAQAFLAANFDDGYLFRGPHRLDKNVRWHSTVVNKLYDLPPDNIGRAFTVARSQEVSIREDALLAVADVKFDPETIVLLEKRSDVLLEYPSWIRFLYRGIGTNGSTDTDQLDQIVGEPINSGVAIIQQGTNHLILRVQSGKPYLFFSNSWHPGWQASVDGKPAEVMVANYNFMGIALPMTQGSFIVTLEFVPVVAYVGYAISGFTALLFCFCWLWYKKNIPKCRTFS
jgi:hypothetical protein